MRGGALDLRHAAAMARDWLTGAAFPFWFAHGIDRVHGGFHDTAGLEGAQIGGFKRTMVQARQVYCFAHAGRMGWSGPWRAAVDIGLDTLERHCRHPDFGFIHSLNEDCTPLETRRDLYDQGFVALALVHAGEALGRVDLVWQARALLVALDERWRDPRGGYFEGETRVQPHRRQNPHMHLFEAAVALARSPFAQAGDIDRVRALGTLFSERLVQPGGCLPELFGADWQPVAGGVAEPGHHFEWIWLLEEARAAGGLDLAPLCKRLWEFAAAHGIDKGRDIVIDQIGCDGAVKAASARLWPQTERLKAALATGPRGEPEALRAFDSLAGYLATPARGAFFDRQLADGTFEIKPARASSLYHLVCAFAALERHVA